MENIRAAETNLKNNDCIALQGIVHRAMPKSSSDEIIFMKAINELKNKLLKYCKPGWSNSNKYRATFVHPHRSAGQNLPKSLIQGCPTFLSGGSYKKHPVFCTKIIVISKKKKVFAQNESPISCFFHQKS